MAIITIKHIFIIQKQGKKDRKIFHSLSTKNEAKAKIKQVELDKNYELKTSNFGLRKFNNYKSIFFYSAAFDFFCIIND